MRRALVVVSFLLPLSSCARAVQKPAAVHSYGVNDTMGRQVRNATDAGDGDYRLRVLRQRVTANPQDFAARVELAALYCESGFPEMAVEHYRAALAQRPESAAVVIALAKTLRKMEMPGEARASLEAFTAQYPKASADASSWLGILQDEAIEY